MATNAFVLSASDYGPMIVNRFDYNQTKKGAYGVSLQLLQTSRYEPQELDLIKQALLQRRQQRGDGVVAIDCGANLGAHTLMMAKLMDGWGRVVSIEAQEWIYYALCGNIALNNCFNVRAEWAAVSDAVGVIRVPRLDYTKVASFGSLEIERRTPGENIGQAIDYSNTYPVPIVTLDALALPRIDFIKVDVEGMEEKVLRGATKTFALCQPVVLLEQIKSNRDNLRAFFKARNYSVTDKGTNILCVPP
jgi:FkbM family methyltransferase